MEKQTFKSYRDLNYDVVQQWAGRNNLNTETQEN
jgi:hypothetical protein